MNSVPKQKQWFRHFIKEESKFILLVAIIRRLPRRLGKNLAFLYRGFIPRVYRRRKLRLFDSCNSLLHGTGSMFPISGSENIHGPRIALLPTHLLVPLPLLLLLRPSCLSATEQTMHPPCPPPRSPSPSSTPQNSPFPPPPSYY